MKFFVADNSAAPSDWKLAHHHHRHPQSQLSRWSIIDFATKGGVYWRIGNGFHCSIISLLFLPPFVFTVVLLSLFARVPTANLRISSIPPSLTTAPRPRPFGAETIPRDYTQTTFTKWTRCQSHPQSEIVQLLKECPREAGLLFKSWTFMHTHLAPGVLNPVIK